MSLPYPAQAGFFSWISRLFSGGQAGAPQEIRATASLSLPLLGSALSSAPPGVGGPDSSDDSPLSSTQESALVASHNPLGIFIDSYNDKILVYTVQPGDVPSIIAENFGISLNTLLWANNIQNPNLIRAGDELIILPVTGVKYEVKKGDTVESIAKKYKADVFDILAFNGLSIDGTLEAGTTIIIPDGEIVLPPAPRSSVVSRASSLPVYAGYYLRPILGGRKSRGLHGYNGVDLAQSCGEPVLASAPGTVIIARSSGWNGGYGRYLVISHPNGTQTLYSHLSTILASVGQYVSQGSQVATVGSTGNSTGCHLHFEVRGAQNPF